ncbi:MAG: FtsX-like permease family protein [Rhodobacteraceae bacterium]|nr:FtsX-like permease family protein [Paracoccaceae bacterium]
MWRAGMAALLSHWRRHPGQGATLILGLALATALWTGVQAINAEARSSYDRAADLLDQHGAKVLVDGGGGTIPVQTYVALRRAGWTLAPVLDGQVQLGGRRVTLLGLDPLSAPVLPVPDSGAGAAAAGSPGGGARALAAYIGPPGTLYTAPETATILKDRVAARLIPSSGVAPGTLVGDLAIVSRFLGKPDRLTRLIVVPGMPPGHRPIAEIAPGLVEREPVAAPDIGGLTATFHLNLTAMGMLAFAVGLLIVHGAIGLAFEERRGTIRTLRALGLPARTLVILVAGELALVALAGGLIGVAVGYAVAAALLPDVAATLRGLYGAPAEGTMAVRPGWVATGLAMAFAGTALASVQSFARLLRLPVLASAQPRAWRLASQAALIRQAALAGALLVLAAFIAWIGRGLMAGFVMLGALLLGAALAAPPLLALLLRRASRLARRPIAQWFWADTRQQLPGLSLALMALLLALAADIGISTMVGSFRATFRDWLDNRLAADFYVDAGGEARAAEVIAWLAPRTDAVLPRVMTDVSLNGQRAQLVGLLDHPYYRKSWPLLTSSRGVWKALARGDGILVNEQFSHRASIRPGHRVVLDGRSEKVLAIYTDYGNPLPQAVMTYRRFRLLYPGVPVTRFAVHARAGDADRLRSALLDEVRLTQDQVTDQAALKRASLAVFERTFAVTDTLKILTLGVAALAMFTSLATLAGQRLPQLAPVWALGLTTAQLGWLELVRAAALAVATAVLALPVGLTLAWVLLSEVNVEAFGWSLPMRFFPADWLWLAGLAILAAVGAAAIPAWRIAHRPPGDLLKVFASER